MNVFRIHEGIAASSVGGGIKKTREGGARKGLTIRGHRCRQRELQLRAAAAHIAWEEAGTVAFEVARPEGRRSEHDREEWRGRRAAHVFACKLEGHQS